MQHPSNNHCNSHPGHFWQWSRSCQDEIGVNEGDSWRFLLETQNTCRRAEKLHWKATIHLVYIFHLPFCLDLQSCDGTGAFLSPQVPRGQLCFYMGTHCKVQARRGTAQTNTEQLSIVKPVQDNSVTHLLFWKSQDICSCYCWKKCI